MIFLEYPKCSTCKNAKKWLDEHGIPYADRHIKEQNPTYEELRAWHIRGGMPLKKFFNTSGILYQSSSGCSPRTACLSNGRSSSRTISF